MHLACVTCTSVKTLLMPYITVHITCKQDLVLCILLSGDVFSRNTLLISAMPNHILHPLQLHGSIFRQELVKAVTYWKHVHYQTKTQQKAHWTTGMNNRGKKLGNIFLTYSKDKKPSHQWLFLHMELSDQHSAGGYLHCINFFLKIWLLILTQIPKII